MKQLFGIFILCFSIIQSSHAQCMEDCVWPGDLNANGIANNLDILAFGFALGETGPSRTDQTTNWEALDADDWTGILPGLGTNFKHIDADGNGIIESQDQFVVSINYNRTNDLFTGLLGDKIPGDDLFVVPQNTVTSPGGSLILDIHLGTETSPINNLYGIGFQLKMDTSYVQDVIFDYTESWIGVDNEIFSYGKFSNEIDHAGMAITRVDGNTIDGFGKIARVEIVITDVVLGLVIDSTACLPFEIEFENVLGIDNEETDLLITTHGDSLTLKNESQLTSIDEIQALANAIEVFPNPANDHVIINSPLFNIEQLSINNVYGQVLLTKAINEQQGQSGLIELSIGHLPAGIYYLNFQNERYRLNKTLIIN